MKIILYNPAVPDIIKTLSKNNRPANRNNYQILDQNFIKLIEAESEDIPGIKDEALYDKVKENKNKLYKLQRIGDIDIYVGWCSDTNGIATLDIQEYDETKQWLLTEYDGSFSIKKIKLHHIGNNIYAMH